MTEEPDVGVDALLTYLRDTRGFDFTGYKRPTLERRIARRMAQAGVSGYAAYLEHLEVHPDEFAALFDTVLINVTSFFRDGPAWEYVAREAVPQILRSKGPATPIRVWSAGCSSGEEACTVAMVLAEALGREEFRERVKIYATDVDEDALATARAGVYSEQSVAAVPEDLRTTYFNRTGDRYTFDKELRRAMIFGRHDVVQDAPISRIDLLVCRNLLIYFNTEAQSSILSRFNFALNDDGFMFLGKAELLLTQGALFQPADLRHRVFKKAVLTVGRAARRGTPVVGAGGDELGRLAFESSTLAQLILDSDNRLVMTNERACLLFDLTGRDIGRPFQDLEVSYRPIDLRSAIDEARATRRVVRLREIEWVRPGGEHLYLDLELTPLLVPGGELAGVAISVHDVSHHHGLQVELEHANAQLESAYEELQSTNEELETTNEELQSTVEELETTNEELQSTNEELETMNEELQSTNEQLQQTNERLRDRTTELHRVNSFLHAIVASVEGAVAVLDSDLRVRLWSARATELWGPRPDEVTGEPFATLDIGLPVGEIVPPIRAVAQNGTEAESLTVVGHDRRGRPATFLVRVAKVRGTGDAAFDGVIVFAEPAGEMPAG